MTKLIMKFNKVCPFCKYEIKPDMEYAYDEEICPCCGYGKLEDIDTIKEDNSNIEFLCLECDNIENLEYEKAVKFFGSKCPKCGGYIIPRLQEDRDALNSVEYR